MSGKVGRPSTYTPEAAEAVLHLLEQGLTLKAACREERMPHEAAVRRWALDDVQGFSSRYARAREIGYLAMADELLEVADDARNDWMERHDPENPGYVLNGEHVQRARLRADTRKWLLAKALPKIFGDKITQEHTGPNGGAQEVVYRWADPGEGG
jgi:hypothetical protein